MQGNDDLRTQLTAALEKSRADAPAEPVETHDTPATAAPDTPPEKPDKPVEATNDGRPRDERGRFVSGGKETEADPAGAVKGISPSSIPADKPAPAEAKPSTAPAPPVGWSAEAKARWHELPPEIQAAVAKREQDAAKLTGKMDEERATGREFRSVVQPYMAMIQAEGVTPAQAVSSLLNTAYVLRSGSPEQKTQALLHVARQFNVPLGQASEGGEPNNELAALRQEVTQLRTQLHSQIQGVEQSNHAAIQSELQAFAADPAHPYYEEVKGVMAALLRSGTASDLQSAYDQACWARPDIRETLNAQQRAEAELKRKAEEKQRAEEARRKSLSVTGAPGVIAPGKPNGNLSLRDEIAQNYRANKNVGAV